MLVRVIVRVFHDADRELFHVMFGVLSSCSVVVLRDDAVASRDQSYESEDIWGNNSDVCLILAVVRTRLAWFSK